MALAKGSALLRDSLGQRDGRHAPRLRADEPSSPRRRHQALLQEYLGQLRGLATASFGDENDGLVRGEGSEKLRAHAAHRQSILLVRAEPIVGRGARTRHCGRCVDRRVSAVWSLPRSFFRRFVLPLLRLLHLLALALLALYLLLAP